MLQLKSRPSIEDAEICILGTNHGMESTILAVSENSILISDLYSTGVMKINSQTGIPSVLIHKKIHATLEKNVNVWLFIS